jgi:MFS family permease
MTLHPSEHLTEEQVEKGLKLVVKDGLTSEAMTTLTSGALLVAMALSMGATNFQIGFLAALPTIANIFQLIAIWLVQRLKNRRLVTVLSVLISRFPLLVIGAMPILFPGGASVAALIMLLSLHYLFGSIAGTSWNSWMKDLVPEKRLGTYFSHRSRLLQILNVTLSLAAALAIDFIKSNYPQYEIQAYCGMFLLGGVFGMIGIYLLSRTPEPKTTITQENLFKLFKRPLKDKNFRKLMVFNSFWAFALNLATPFFSVYLMKMIHLPLSYIIGLTILSQLTSIMFIRVWGRYSDKFSNKTIIGICAPIYIACIFAWTFTTMPAVHMFTIPLLILIHIFSGIATAGINLALSNIVFKLAPKGEAIVYISARSMMTALISAIAPMIGGLMADFFTSHQLAWNIQWTGPEGSTMFHLIELQQWDFFFVLGGLMAIFSLRWLSSLKEEGEVQKRVVVKEMAVSFRKELKARTRKEALMAMAYKPFSFIPSVKQKMALRLMTEGISFGCRITSMLEKEQREVEAMVLAVRKKKYRRISVRLNVPDEDLVLIED